MKSAFNIYYMNKEKASEISMLFDNQIVEKITDIKNTSNSIAGEISLESGKKEVPLIGKYLPNLDADGSANRNSFNSVENIVKVVSSNSTILRPIYEKSVEVRSLKDSKVGNLVKIKNVSLAITNSKDVMATRALMSGIMSKVPIEGVGNLNLTSFLQAIFKDSAYVLCGKLPDKFGHNQNMILKIPMSPENEMESSYSISDLEIGKVTVLGIYRGKYKRAQVEKKINLIMALNDEANHVNASSNISTNDDIEEDDSISNVNEENDYHYIDVIAIIQDIDI